MKLPDFASFLDHTNRIAVVGLGYVGLPLAVHLSAHFSVVGYDVRENRIAELKRGYDRTLEVAPDDLKKAAIDYSSDSRKLSDCRVIIVAVPTPIDDSRIPDLRPVENAAAVGRHQNLGLGGVAALCRDGRPIVIDVKALFSPEEAKRQDIRHWRL